jgi:hypothetical protein
VDVEVVAGDDGEARAGGELLPGVGPDGPDGGLEEAGDGEVHRRREPASRPHLPALLVLERVAEGDDAQLPRPRDPGRELGLLEVGERPQPLERELLLARFAQGRAPPDLLLEVGPLLDGARRQAEPLLHVVAEGGEALEPVDAGALQLARGPAQDAVPGGAERDLPEPQRLAEQRQLPELLGEPDALQGRPRLEVEALPGVVVEAEADLQEPVALRHREEPLGDGQVEGAVDGGGRQDPALELRVEAGALVDELIEVGALEVRQLDERRRHEAGAARLGASPELRGCRANGVHRGAALRVRHRCETDREPGEGDSYDPGSSPPRSRRRRGL